MSTLRITLRCLLHPATLLSIGVLLVNDHWLKAEFPSWWTSKLSDFAGLFFFPFLVAPLFGLLLDKKNLSPIAAGRLAFSLTAIWFASFKTLPLANAASCLFLSILLGHPVQLVLDPTDLIALPVLVPAWWLWLHETRVGDSRPSKLAWIAMAAGVLATVATSPAPPIYDIQRLGVEGDKLYAYVPSPPAAPSDPRWQAASSTDGGRTWNTLSSSTPVPLFRRPTEQGCDPNDAKVCYRILPERVEASLDGGTTYQVAWSIPWGRRFFMERENRGSVGLLGQPKLIDMGPYDFVFAPPVGANGLSTVVFAMGNEGVLVRTPEGEWNRYAVWTAQPTRFAASGLSDAVGALPFETDVVAFVGLLAFSFMSYRTASRFKTLGGSTHWVGWAIWPLVVADGILLIGWGAFAWNGFYRLGSFWALGLPYFSLIVVPYPQSLLFLFLFAVVPWILIVWAWTRIAKLWPNSGVALATFWRTVRFSIALALLTFMPLALWAFGIIPLYELAVAVSVVLGAAVIGIAIKRVPGYLPPPETQSL